MDALPTNVWTCLFKRHVTCSTIKNLGRTSKDFHDAVGRYLHARIVRNIEVDGYAQIDHKCPYCGHEGVLVKPGKKGTNVTCPHCLSYFVLRS